jgi:hypothetical protein
MKTLLNLFASFVLTVVFFSASFAQSPGDTIGWTTYPYQCNGSTGRRIALDNSGGLHFTWQWMSQSGSTRNVKYNCFGPTFPSPWPKEGVNIGFTNSGYPQISVREDDRAVVAFHNAASGAESLYVATDVFQCQGTFFTRHPPNRLGTSPVNRILWPYITVDSNGRVHIVATTTTNNLPYTYEPIGYARSNNGGTTWTALAAVDTSRVISSIIVSSKVSDKVAVIYCHPAQGDTTGGRNDVYYIQSTDGITWDNFANKVNITNYGFGGDSLFAWEEVSAVYDYNGDLHIVWPVHYARGPINSRPTFLYSGSHLAHWDQALNTISYFGDFPPSWPQSGCDLGAGNFAFSKVSITTTPFQWHDVAVAYTGWDSTDCSASGYANGDIYYTVSTDNGATWRPATNITHSRSPNCLPGDCASDLFPSMTEFSDGTGRENIFYICDRTGTGGQGSGNINNPALYLNWPNVGVENNSPLPAGYSLSQNYPNPFNAQTSIKFNLPAKSHIKLSIYNVLGEELTVLFRGTSEPGQHEINWNASNFPSGVYFAHLEAGEGSQSIKMVLLK